jgi:hypothetical protein
MTRYLKLSASKGTDVPEKTWKEFVNEFKRMFSMYDISGGVKSEYVTADKMHVGGFPDVSFYAEKFKQFEGSNIYLELYDLEVEPESTHTL